MKQELKQAFETEMVMAKSLYRSGQLEAAFKHTETAHVLGQRYVVPHVRSHWMMLKIGCRRHSAGEVLGQAVRIVLGALGSAVGVIPIGNTGGTDINMFKRLPIAPDLARMLEKD